MRPALLRLLRRPSAVSILDCLVSTPTGIEQLETRYKCLRRQLRSIQRRTDTAQFKPKPIGNKLPARQHQTHAKSFRVYEIEPLQDDRDGDPTNAFRTSDKGSTIVDSTKPLNLQPEELEFESDIGHANDIGTRLVDDPSHRHDFALWEELLRYRQRHYGHEGTLDIWQGLTVRVGGVHLPVNGDRADFFWQSFVDLGLKREPVLKELTIYALELWDKKGNRWTGFYDSVVGGFLERGMVQQAVEWHNALRHPHLSHPNEILRVLELAIAPSSPPDTTSLEVLHRDAKRIMSPGVRAFQDICRETDGHRIYGPVISTLVQNGYPEDALLMHEFLVERQDHPRTYEEMQPLLDYVEKYESLSVLEELQEYARSQFGNQTESNSREGRVGQDAESKAKGGRWLKPKPVKDEFAARLFATSALTFDMILGGLQMFGVRAIGPQPLREMAIRSHGCQDLLKKLNQLQKAGISTGDSVFARLVRKLAAEDRGILLSEVILSDKHPDVFEDASLQESLLAQHYMARDWRQYNMTLAVLDLLSEEGSEMPNIHFRKYIATREWSSAAKLVDKMSLCGKTLTSDSVEFLVSHILTPRRKGAAPAADHHRRGEDQVGFVIRILRRVVPTGVFVFPELWIELLKRLGMTGRWDDLRELSLWIARHYSNGAKRARAPWTSAPSQASGKFPITEMGLPPRGPGDCILEHVFNPQMQSAIVAWGFKMRTSSKPETKTNRIPSNYPGEKNENTIIVPWVRGLALLRELEREGVHLCEREIRQACRHRLAVLFGWSRHSSRRWNRLLRRENPYTLYQVLADITRVWGCPLFRGREVNDVERLVNPPSSRMSLRRTQRTLFREAQFEGGAFVRSK